MPRTSIITPEKFTTFGELLRFLRRKADLTQRELSIAVGYSESQISRLEQNERAPEEATLAARFVPALYIDDEPQWVARLLELGAATHSPTYEVEAPQPIAEAKPTPHNLPIQLTSFIGREKEITEIKRLLLNDQGIIRLLTLTGSGGCGKTRLALQAASEIANVFPDGVWFIEFAPLTDPLLVPQAVALVLGLKEELDRNLLSTLTDHLRGKKVLLILDNCEHLIEAVAKLAELLLHACPSMRILATSREVLDVAGEISFLVPSLSSPGLQHPIQIDSLTQYESIRLFLNRAETALRGFAMTNDNAPAVMQVCHRLDGIPLAIELAAARVKLLRVEQIAERLDDRFQLLTSGGRTSLPRHQTLAALIDWSHDLLAESERILLGRLSVFAGGWTLEAAESVCVGDGIEQSRVLDLLTQLVNKSLVIAEREQGKEARYGMLETIRQYALEKLIASGEVDATQHQHATYYLVQAETGSKSLGPGYYHLAHERNNLRSALTWSLSSTGNTELALRLATAAALGMSPAEACRWLEAALGHGATSGEDSRLARGEAIIALGTNLTNQGKYAAAQIQMARGLKLIQKTGDRSKIAWIHNRLGWLAREQDDATTARAQLEKSMALYRELGDQVGLAWTLLTLGEVAVLQQEEVGWAIPILEEGLRLMREQKNGWGMGWALNHLGHLAQVLGEYARASRLHGESMSVFRQLEGGSATGIIWGLQSLGEIALAENRPTVAVEHFTNAFDLCQRGGFRAETAWCLAGLAGVAALNEEPERAAWLWGAAEAHRHSLGARPSPAARATHERLQSDVRKQLGKETFNAKWAEGQAASVEQAIDEAMQ